MEMEEMVNEAAAGELKESGKTGKYGRIVVISVLALFLIIFLMLSVLAPLRSYKNFRQTWVMDDSIMVALLNNNASADSIALANAVIKSKIAVAELDSIGFILNLRDSLLVLQLEGVDIHKIKISKFRYSKMLENLSPENAYSFYSSPFYINNYESTIVKVPIVVKHAPRDTAEANLMNSAPKIPAEDYVKYTFMFDKNLELFVSQCDSLRNHRFKAFFAGAEEDMKYVKKIIRAGMRFKIPEYTPWIKIEIPADEAKTVFRALPENAAMVLIVK